MFKICTIIKYDPGVNEYVNVLVQITYILYMNVPPVSDVNLRGHSMRVGI